jgi:hypothetical protein
MKAPKWFWIAAAIGVVLYLYSKREVHATVTAGDATITYKSDLSGPASFNDILSARSDWAAKNGYIV